AQAIATEVTPASTIRVTRARTKPPGPRARIPRAHEKGPHPPDLRRTRGPPALPRVGAGHHSRGRRDHVDHVGSPGPSLAGGALLAVRVPAHLPPAALPVLHRLALRGLREPGRGEGGAGAGFVAARPCPRPHRGGALRRAGRPRGLARAATFLALAIGVVAPWTCRNWRVYDAFVPVSTAGALNLWQGNATISREEVYEQYRAVRGRIEKYRLARQKGLEAIWARQPAWFFEKLRQEMPNFWE